MEINTDKNLWTTKESIFSQTEMKVALRNMQSIKYRAIAQDDNRWLRSLETRLNPV
jgi:hypothetical protein